MKTLFAFCDLALTAASFDFITFLVRAMKVRDERGCDGLHIVFVPNENDPAAGAFRKWGKHDDAATAWRFWHICVASLPLARATMTLAPDRKHAEIFHSRIRTQKTGADKYGTLMDGEFWWPEGKAHFMGPLVIAARNGEPIPRLRATDAARRYVERWPALNTGRPLVTITHRHQDTDADRNTSGAMFGFGEWLEGDQGMSIIHIDDTHESLLSGDVGLAELDPDLRLALYEQARMNVIGNNGPQELLKFSDAPYLAFGQCPTLAWADHWRKYFGMEPGEQLPWASKNQRLVYAPDTLENLKAEFLRWAYESQG